MNCPGPPEAGKVAELASLWLVGRFSRLWRPQYMIFLYVMKSRFKKFRYVGITNNLARRIHEHNSGKNKSTEKYAPFDLKLKEEYANYLEARKREKFLKSGQGRKFLNTLK